jgi:hypothetical protein
MRRFFGLDLKTKWAMVCRLHLKTDVRVTAWDTRQDLAVCFPWKQITLRFPSLASRLVDAQRRMVHVASSLRLRREEAEDGRVDATGCVRPLYLKIFIIYVLCPRSSLVF